MFVPLHYLRRTCHEDEVHRLEQQLIQRHTVRARSAPAAAPTPTATAAAATAATATTAAASRRPLPIGDHVGEADPQVGQFGARAAADEGKHGVHQSLQARLFMSIREGLACHPLARRVVHEGAAEVHADLRQVQRVACHRDLVSVGARVLARVSVGVSVCVCV